MPTHPARRLRPWSVLLLAAGLAGGSSLAQRLPVLRQFDLPHPY